jgi:hypothetical protein
MKPRLVVAVMLVGALTVLTGVLLAQEESKPQTPAASERPAGTPDMAEMMAKWKAVSSPSEHHQHLAPFVGEWDVTMKMWMAGPKMPPYQTTGTATVKWVLGGRFLLEEFHCDICMPDEAGQFKTVPFEGIGMTGYDNYRNVYVASWADNFNTHLLTTTGTRDRAGKVFTYYGQMDEPMLNVTGRTIKYVTRIVSDDEHVMEMYDLHTGDDYKVFEVVYQRQKPQ